MRREILRIEHKLMQILRKKITAIRSTVSIIDGKERSPDPILHNIQYDAHSVLVVLPRYALIRIHGIGLYIAVLFTADF